MDIPKTPLKIDHETLKPEIKENYPQNLERENKNCYICGDSSHYADYSPLVSMERKKGIRTAADSGSQVGRLWHPRNPVVLII
ncbi:hypothetical protein TNCV_922891 [Trichonephila clavipes]|nr:hypothetical protein TNCV_922891 [Trichonephila clavipes]